MISIQLSPEKPSSYYKFALSGDCRRDKDGIDVLYHIFYSHRQSLLDMVEVFGWEVKTRVFIFTPAPSCLLGANRDETLSRQKLARWTNSLQILFICLYLKPGLKKDIHIFQNLRLLLKCHVKIFLFTCKAAWHGQGGRREKGLDISAQDKIAFMEAKPHVLAFQSFLSALLKHYFIHIIPYLDVCSYPSLRLRYTHFSLMRCF